MASSRVVQAVMVGVILGAGFAACAKGNELGGVGGGGGTVPTGITTSSGMPDAGMMPGPIGSPCPDGKCAEGTCTLIGSTAYCTTACPPACPDGTYCSVIGGNPLCVPDLGQQCAQCTTASDCKLPSDACLTAPPGDNFCARDCSIDGECPNGFVCADMTSYENPDAGTSGTDGGTTDGGTGSGGDGGTTVPSAPNRWCVPDDGASCPCNSKRDGVTHACSVSNASGTCTGTETCSGEISSWMGCTAQTPAPEKCNGMDDNCNGQIDEGNPNTLCSFMGAPPANANWACVNGMCQLGACDTGWTVYPSGSSAAGCACPVDADEPNNTCAQAHQAGSVTSTGGTPLTLEGTLSSDSDIDVYAFTTTDVNQTTTNSYHVAISFTQPSPNNEFVMDVIRGACSDAPTGGATNITSYDWCVNSTATANGEAPCGPTAVHHCADHSSQYYVRVYRKAGVTGTCAQYQISVSGGGGTCDLTQTCM